MVVAEVGADPDQIESLNLSRNATVDNCEEYLSNFVQMVEALFGSNLPQIIAARFHIQENVKLSRMA